jgi:hypothetical protein
MAPTRPSSHNRGWWRDYFIDHPGLKAKLPDASTGTGSSAKAKVYCLKCFESHVNAVLAEDQVEVDAVPPRRQAVRAVSDIEAHCKSFISFLLGAFPVSSTHSMEYGSIFQYTRLAAISKNYTSSTSTIL